MRRPSIARALFGVSAFASLGAAGCSRAPSYDLMGSLFPAWILCIVLGILLALLARWLLQRARIAVLFPVLVYPCMAAAFTFAIWLIFFQ
jgi:hypothetical protein